MEKYNANFVIDILRSKLNSLLKIFKSVPIWFYLVNGGVLYLVLSYDIKSVYDLVASPENYSYVDRWNLGESYCMMFEGGGYFAKCTKPTTLAIHLNSIVFCAFFILLNFYYLIKKKHSFLLSILFLFLIVVAVCFNKEFITLSLCCHNPKLYFLTNFFNQYLS